MTDLEERRRLTVLGQVTWAEPEMGARCADCAYWEAQKVRNGVKVGTCGLVLVHAPRMKLVAFAGESAIACPKFLQRPLVGGLQ